MNMMEWVICPICNNKTRIKIRKDTQLLESDRNSHPKASRINQSESDRNSQS